VFFAIGFETTAPTTAMAVKQAAAEHLGNFSLLVAHVLVPPALQALLSSPGNRIQGLLAPGHVCTVTGVTDYERLAERFKIPVTITGFEPADLMQGIFKCIQMLESGTHEVENCYSRCVRHNGNPVAMRAVNEVYMPVTRDWRGIGAITGGGLALREDWAAFDAERRFGLAVSAPGGESPLCHAGEVLKGNLTPTNCPAFGSACTPENPLGAPMVSAEAACAAYFQYKRPTARRESKGSKP